MGWIEDNTSKDPIAKEGMRIRMLYMDDQHGVDEGMEGTIVRIDDLGTLHVHWDDGSQLGVIPKLDKYQLLPPENEQIDLDIFGEADFKLSSASKKNKMAKKTNLNFKRELSKTKPRVRDVKTEAKGIKGGEAEGMSVQDLAKKHKVDVKDIEKEIKVGTEIEMEHTDSKTKAKEIAMDHISEFPDYYTNKKYGLKSSEKGLESIHENKMSLKDEVQRILNTIKTSKPIHKESLENMVNNLVNKYKNIKKDEDKFYDLIEKLRSKINNKFGVEETTTTGALGSSPIQPLGTDINRGKLSKTVSTDVVTKGNIKNPMGKIYSLKKESKTIKVGDLINELSSTSATKLRDGGSYDGDSWVGDKKSGWKRRKELVWKGGEISDILAKLDINWNDSNLSLSKKQTDKINEGWLKKTKEDKLALEILERVKKEYPQNTKMNSFRYGNGYYIEFTLEGIRGNVKVRIENAYSTGALRDSYGLWVNDRKLLASRWAIKKLYKYISKEFTKRKEAEDLRNIETDLISPDYAEDVFDMLDDSEQMNEAKKSKESPIHTKKWERCVKDVEKKNKENKTDYNPYAVCQKSIGYEGSIKKPHRRKEKEEIEETTTFSSVFGGEFPVTPFMFAKKGKHIPSKKPIWKGGKIVQKADKADLLGESILDEINKVKWVKGGKFVKIKDRCAKYNNKPWCSQGAIDNPLELSDTVFENIKKISKKTGLSEENILNKIKLKLKGVDKHQIEYNKKHGLPLDWKGSR